jgi:hypothetical protein
MTLPTPYVVTATTLSVATLLLTFTIRHDSGSTPGTPQEQAQTTSQLIQLQTASAPMKPDEFSWKIFASISQPLPNSYQQKIPTPGGAPVTTNDVAWEQFADNSWTFRLDLDDTVRNVNDKPAYPNYDLVAARNGTMNNPGKHLKEDPILTLLKSRVSTSRRGRGLNPAIMGDEAAFGKTGDLEEVRRNAVSFQWLVDNNYWTQEGLAAATTSAVQHHNKLLDSIFTMPDGSVEVKAYWTPCSLPANASACALSKAHLNYASDGKQYALVSLHIMTKVNGRWVFSSWEWAGDDKAPQKKDGNPGRCDIIGCIDRFGIQNGAGTNRGITKALNSTKLLSLYSPGSMTPELNAVFNAYHLDPVWRNYRLKATQMESDQSTSGATPTLVGNSQFERPYVGSSSCISCHARSGVDKYGAQVDFKDPNWPLFQDSSDGKLIGPTTKLQERWFTRPANPASPHNQVQQYWRTDSMWSLLHARSARQHSNQGH